MDFLRRCAQRLDDGEDAEEVMRCVRERYKTIRCLNVKTSLIRKMCRLSDAFVTKADGDAQLLSGARRPPPDFPPRHPPNVEAFKISRQEMKECKRLSSRSALEKNRKVRRVDGRGILKACREEVESVVSGDREASPLLVLSLMLLTGRRTCEIVNGKSSFLAMGEYGLLFSGQAKRRNEGESYVVPCLLRASTVVAAFEKIKRWLSPAPETSGMTMNQASSQKYQSWLRRWLLSHPVLCQAGTVHSLRGLYARMTFRLFTWGDYSEAFVVMKVLGHVGLSETLVYTTFHLGDTFRDEPLLGDQSWDREEESLVATDADLNCSRPLIRRSSSLKAESISILVDGAGCRQV